MDEILWSDHSNDSFLPVLSHGATCFSKFYKMKFGIFFVEFCLWPRLAVNGLKSVLNRLFGIRELPYLKAGIRDFKAKWGQDLRFKVRVGCGMFKITLGITELGKH